jgi:hypothetical protein
MRYFFKIDLDLQTATKAVSVFHTDCLKAENQMSIPLGFRDFIGGRLCYL